MALAAGDVVSMTQFSFLNQNGLLGPLVQAQPPSFGIVATDPNAGSVAVLWEDGRYDAAIPTTALDRIGVPDAGMVAELQGFVLKTDPAVGSQQESPEFQGIAVTFYTRDKNGAGTPSETLCLMRLNFFGTYRELLASALTTVGGR